VISNSQRNASPLRYPGGKSVLAPVIASIIESNDLADCVYVEPYAGGAGAALTLLYAEHVSQLLLNDKDRSVYAFWKTILTDTAALCSMIEQVPLTMVEWNRQKVTYTKRTKRGRLFDVGFSAFYLNRCNRSGIIATAGPIGGKEQTGNWKLDARFNREDLVERVKNVAAYADRIRVSNNDAIDFLDRIRKKNDPEKTFIYLDPPYYVKGSKLYLNSYLHSDHEALARKLKEMQDFKWVLTYDDVPEIRQLYDFVQCQPFDIKYSVQAVRQGRELFFMSPALHTFNHFANDLPAEVCCP